MKNLPIYLSVVLGIVLGWILTITFTPKCPNVVSEVSWDKPDTNDFKTPAPVIKYVTGEIRYKDTGRLLMIPLPHKPLSKTDSVKIFQAFFATNTDTATIVNDSNLWVRLNYGITQNKLISGTGQYLIKKPTQIITNHITNPSTNQLYLGIGTGTDFSNAFKIEGRITLKTKKDNLWGFKVEKVSGIPKPVYSVSHDFKISFKK